METVIDKSNKKKVDGTLVEHVNGCDSCFEFRYFTAVGYTANEMVM